MAKIFVVGLGPGGVEQMTKRAIDALNSCDVIAGYHVYVNLIKEDFADKKFLSTGMRKEVDRCKLTLEEALKGQTVAMISSGDAGVYGMAGIMYQVAAGKKSKNVCIALLKQIFAFAFIIRPVLSATIIYSVLATLCLKTNEVMCLPVLCVTLVAKVKLAKLLLFKSCVI